MSSLPAKQPFWIDGPEIQYKPPPSKGVLPPIILLMLIVYRILLLIFLIGGASFILYQLAPILAGVFLLFFAFLYGFAIYLGKRRKRSGLDIAEIQQKARELSGASVMGSAIHVAGHPLLEREQSVVLALTSDSLKIFRYDNQVPIDIISLNQLAGFYTVVYDDDRYPHIDIVDSTAQALQITYIFHDKEFTCLFRRMLKVRPIDWCHEIQKARWNIIN